MLKHNPIHNHIMDDPVNHPSHYVSHPSGVEAIQITEHMGFCLGNAMKYIWRADLKGNSIEDLEKAIWYVQREVEKRKLADFNAASDKFMAGSAYHKESPDKFTLAQKLGGTTPNPHDTYGRAVY